MSGPKYQAQRPETVSNTCGDIFRLDALALIVARVSGGIVRSLTYCNAMLNIWMSSFGLSNLLIDAFSIL